MQRYFKASPPSVHQMVLAFEREGFPHQPGGARSIEMLIDPQCLAVLRHTAIQSVKITVRGY